MSNQTVSIESWRDTWIKCYRITLKSKASYLRRLRELQTWDTPRCKPENDQTGKLPEHAGKIAALNVLIDESNKS